MKRLTDIINRPAAIVILSVLLMGAFTAHAAYGQTGAQEKILVSTFNKTQTNDILYSMNPDGKGSMKLFDFSRHPRHTQGRILHLHIASDGRTIYFSSDNAYTYTPASRNLFRISSNGLAWEQFTPGPNSGKWDTPCPCGTVTGTVKRSNGMAYSNTAVFLESKGMVYSNADGSFRFDKVPQGKRWIVAYRPGSTVFESREIMVVPNLVSRADLVPNSDFRWSFTNPVVYGNRIYYRSGLNKIEWRTVKSDTGVGIYTSTGSCTGLTNVDGFHVAPTSGRLAIMDYQQGCTTNRGLYIADRDGGQMGLLLDMKANQNWGDPGEVFWSPDESKIAIK
ncbi:MAG: carboxypeptidase regulatory-like domain-containing protein, partial [bacterium]|nr:carboxypeptidase regulatory-like domain-containing protein [bacterium]